MIAVAELVRALARANGLRAEAPGSAACGAVEAVLDDLFGTGARLVVYGSLRPGEANHAELGGVVGDWSGVFVRGRIDDRGWRRRQGYPVLHWDLDGALLPVHLFVSADLRRSWPRLDAFEGQEYRRILLPVHDAAGAVTGVANAYVGATSG